MRNSTPVEKYNCCKFYISTKMSAEAHSTFITFTIGHMRYLTCKQSRTGPDIAIVFQHSLFCSNYLMFWFKIYICVDRS